MKTDTPNTTCSAPPEAGSTIQVAIQTAIECMVQAVLVILLGGLALDIAGGICKSMIPAIPPAFAPPPLVENPLPANSPPGVLGPWLYDHRFALVFACIFIPTLCTKFGFLGASPAAARFSKLHRRIVNDWFSLIVVNAFIASISAVALSWLHGLSTGRMLATVFMEWTANALGPLISLFAVEPNGWAQQWSAWYGENALKLTFWFFYITAICDDLGIPNLKTVVRKGLRQFRAGGT